VRLTHLKLAGFKSFVDPTTIPVPGQLVAVIGPNGCGKSNVIDAVRWVLGESSAKQLRGESMQDVIFNGSSTRKPVSRASVELVFDNSEGRASGPWGQFAEISIKRVLTRQGESSYWINQQQVRRRDIADLFLGTGVGAKGYAVIEQGMISRIIEARPEELRAYLEEAAGVSRYKERRRETESRLSDTRDNLARIEDIRQELERQTEKLLEQAEVAQQYHGLRDALTHKQNLLAMARRRDAQQAEAKARAELARLEAELEGMSSQGTELDARLEAAREAHFAATDAVHQRQAEQAEASAQLARLEEQQRHRRDTASRLQRDLDGVRQELAGLSQQERQLNDEIEHWEDQLEEARLAAEEAALAHDGEDDGVPAAEALFRQADEALNTLTRRQAELTRQRDLARQQAQHAETALRRQAERRERLHDEARRLSGEDSEALSLAREALAQAETEAEQAREVTQQAEAALEQLTRQRQERQALHTRQRDALTRLHADLTALDKLLAQAARAGRGEAWLAEHGLAGQAPLWRQLDIQPGWETAVEAALAPLLSARAVDDWPSDAPPSRLALLARHADEPAAEAEPLPLPTLASKLSLRAPELTGALADWLRGGYVVDSLDELYRWQARLGPGQWLVCRDGHRAMGASVAYWAADADSGMIGRQAERERLAAEHEALAPEVTALGEACAALDAELHDQQQALRQLRQHATSAEQARAQAALHCARQEHTQAQHAARRAAIDEEQARLDEEAEQEHASIEHANLLAEEAELQLDELSLALEQAQVRRLDAETGLTLARTRSRELERHAQEARFALSTAQNRLNELEHRRDDLSERRDTLNERQENLVIEQDSLIQSDLDELLQSALIVRDECEEKLIAARDAANHATELLRQLTQARQQVDGALDPLRDAINDWRLKSQEALLTVERFDEELRNAEADETALLADLTDAVKASGLVGEIGKLTQAITGLGAVNLAALDELTAARERHDYLAEQAADLTAAMDTLLEAIAKMDGETRDMLQSTFDQVNASMRELFPLLFGGGRAELTLTGEDLLDAGVQIIAQPPGKKNSTIHLLSGGEKALTAMSLVFSLFRLNPAPFCLLDEVDAPLDDANTGRFCELVKRMADRTQFLYISHNRLTMEMAEQLIGVTMQEQGVSRIVAVDIVEALKMREQ